MKNARETTSRGRKRATAPSPDPRSAAPEPREIAPGAKDLTPVVGGNLRRLRGQRGLSLERLSQVSGVSRAMLGQVELGQSAPTINVLWKISSALGVPFSALITARGTPGPHVLRGEQAKHLTSHDGAFLQGILELPSGDQSRLVCAVEDEFSAPLGDDVAHLAHGQREERHGHAHDDQPGLVLACNAGKRVEVDRKLFHVEWHVIDLQAARSRRSVLAVARMPAERLRRRHDHIARLRERVVDCHVAQHAAHEAVVGVVAAERHLQELDAQ
jgi:transcriptional regulator with XRE-family HTH domain